MTTRETCNVCNKPVPPNQIIFSCPNCNRVTQAAGAMALLVGIVMLMISVMGLVYRMEMMIVPVLILLPWWLVLIYTQYKHSSYRRNSWIP